MCGSANDILLEFRIIYYLVSHIYSYASKEFFFLSVILLILMTYHTNKGK